MRFAMRIDPWWLPGLLLVGVLPGNSYVALAGDSVRVRFGLFRYRVPRASIVAARRMERMRLWTLGIGIHGNLVNALAINGSVAGVVELRLAPARTFWVLFIPMRVSRLYLSLEAPDAFLRALGVPAPVGKS
ncbi:MAG TPA: hypothetical protein VII06_15185 [Chloroflexota bacterium]|jgi:hypothetical protein